MYTLASACSSILAIWGGVVVSTTLWSHPSSARVHEQVSDDRGAVINHVVLDIPPPPSLAEELAADLLRDVTGLGELAHDLDQLIVLYGFKDPIGHQQYVLVGGRAHVRGDLRLVNDADERREGAQHA